jgi:hypothetical protein
LENLEAARPDTRTGASRSPDLAAIPEPQWNIAKCRFEAIRPLLEYSPLDAGAITEQARLCQVHRSTLYRWLAAYLQAPGLDSLLPHKRGYSRGTHQLVPEVEAVIRRDPRDISAVYFFDPELNCYFEIPYRDTSRPALTLWELREARTRLKQQGVTNMDEDLIFQAYRKLRAIEEEASTATRKAHRPPLTDDGTKAGEAVLEVAPPADGDNDDRIRPFEEIEPWP